MTLPPDRPRLRSAPLGAMARARSPLFMAQLGRLRRSSVRGCQENFRRSERKIFRPRPGLSAQKGPVNISEAYYFPSVSTKGETSLKIDVDSRGGVLHKQHTDGDAASKRLPELGFFELLEAYII